MGKAYLPLLAAVLLVLNSCKDPLRNSTGGGEKPIADAGSDLTGVVGIAVALDGSSSRDPDGDRLSYRWQITNTPLGSTAAVPINRLAKTTSFIPTAAGTYTVELAVSDADSETVDTLRVTVYENVAIVDASVPNGQTNASINAVIGLRFNTAMDWDSFTNAVTMKTGAASAYNPVVSVLDPVLNYILIAVPSTLLDPVSGKLLSNATYTITVPRTVRTIDGSELISDIVHEFTTFTYGLEFDDSAAVDGETFGIAYHEPTDSLYYVGETSFPDFVVRRHAVGSGSAVTELTNAAAQVLYGGLKLWDGVLYLSKSYDSEVAAYPILGDGTFDLGASATYGATTLAPPADSLSEVLNTVKLGASLYFTTGSWHGGTAFQDVIKFDGSAWSVAVSGSANGFANDEAKNITGINEAGTDYLYMAEGVTKKLFKFRASDGVLVNSATTAHSFYEADLACDAAGNLYVGTSGGIYKYSPDLVLLDKREGLDARRIAVKNSGGGSARVYYVKYRNPAVLGYADF